MLQNINDEKYCITLEIKHGLLTQVLDWCNKNCMGEWVFMDSDTGDSRYPCWRFIFYNQQDIILFTLKWQ
jgi:hypothetical protein